MIKEYEIIVDEDRLEDEYNHLRRKFLKFKAFNSNFLFSITVDKEKKIIKVKQTVLQDGSSN